MEFAGGDGIAYLDVDEDDGDGLKTIVVAKPRLNPQSERRRTQGHDTKISRNTNKQAIARSLSGRPLTNQIKSQKSSQWGNKLNAGEEGDSLPFIFFLVLSPMGIEKDRQFGVPILGVEYNDRLRSITWTGDGRQNGVGVELAVCAHSSLIRSRLTEPGLIESIILEFDLKLDSSSLVT